MPQYSSFGRRRTLSQRANEAVDYMWETGESFSIVHYYITSHRHSEPQTKTALYETIVQCELKESRRFRE